MAPNSKTFWTAQERQVLRENYHKMPAKELGEILGRTGDAIIRQAQKIGIEPKRAQWKDWELNILKDHPFISAKAMQELLPNRDYISIIKKMQKLGIYTYHESRKESKNQAFDNLI